MPDDSAVLEVKIENADASEQVILKANSWDRSKNLKTTVNTIIANVPEEISGNLEGIRFEQWTIDGRIAQPDTDTWSSSLEDIASSSNAELKENALANAADQFVPTAKDALPTLTVENKTIDGFASQYDSSRTAGEGTKKYTYTLQWFRIDLATEE